MKCILIFESPICVLLLIMFYERVTLIFWPTMLGKKLLQGRNKRKWSMDGILTWYSNKLFSSLKKEFFAISRFYKSKIIFFVLQFLIFNEQFWMCCCIFLHDCIEVFIALIWCLLLDCIEYWVGCLNWLVHIIMNYWSGLLCISICSISIGWEVLSVYLSVTWIL